MDVPISAKAALLEALLGDEGYGLDLIDRVKERSNGGIVLGPGSVYPALRDLERHGLVTSYEADALSERGGRPRRYYKLTPEGSRVAREQRSIVARFYTPAMARV